MKDFINKKVKVTEELLLEIKNKTTTYSKTEDLEYALLISDLNKVIAIELVAMPTNALNATRIRLTTMPIILVFTIFSCLDIKII